VAPIPVPSQVAGDLPPAFDRWWAKAANREPTLRWQSAKELAEGLGLAFGLSPGASVVEAPGRGSYGIGDAPFPVTGQTGPAMHGQVPAATPVFAQTPSGPDFGQHGQHGSQPGFGLTPGQVPMAPHGFGATPGQAAMPPAGFGITPGLHAGAGGTALPTTGTPLARSLLGAPEIPKHSRAGMWLALGAGVVALVTLSAVGVTVAMKNKHLAAPTSSTPFTPESAASVATPVPSSTPPEQPAPPPVQPRSPAPAVEATGASGSVPAQPVAKPAKQPAPQPAKPAPSPAPTKPPKGKPAVDLGI
jgi:serine/threonine-protein kinase